MAFIPTGQIIKGGVDAIDVSVEKDFTIYTLLVSAPLEKMAILRTKLWGLAFFPPRNLEIVSIENIVDNPIFKQWKVMAKTPRKRGIKEGEEPDEEEEEEEEEEDKDEEEKK